MAVVTPELAEKILVQAQQQLRTSRQFKRERMRQITENENLYLGIVEKQLRNPFNESYPFMPGFIDYYRARIEDDSMLTFGHQAEADLKRSMKIQGMYDRVSKSPAPNDSWSIKHRYAKHNALFSGRAIYKIFAEKDPDYKSHLHVPSHYDFHNEPRGGGILESHLFCGEDNIFRKLEDLKAGAQYDKPQVDKLGLAFKNNGFKDLFDPESNRNNRFAALGQQPESHTYVGSDTVKLVDWYTTYNGKRYYILFNEAASVWVRCVELTDLFPDDLWPYVSWATNEDPDVFWSKAPADDARPIAKIINNFINQELLNRQKRNEGQRIYDVDMFPNVAALADWRPNGLIPANRTDKSVALSSGIHEVKVGDLNGTLELVSFLNNFSGQKLGNTSSSEGSSPASKQATVFMGEIEQTDKLIGIKNKSYYDALSQLGLRFKQGLDHNLSKPEAVKIMGGRGVEWEELTPEDCKTERELTIIPSGGTSEAQLKRAQDAEKASVLGTLQVVNPQWKEREMLRLKGYDDDALREAFSTSTMAEKELLSEAALAEKEIVEGGEPKLNRGATAAFMQHIVDFATDTDDLPMDRYVALMDYAEAHVDIVLENMNRDVKKMLADRAAIALSTPLPARTEAPPVAGGMMPNNAPNGIPEGGPG